MENFRFILFIIATFAVLGGLGFWAFKTIEPGDIHKERQLIESLRKENETLKEEVEKLESELALLAPEEVVGGAVAGEAPAPAPAPTPAPTTQTAFKYQGLIGELEELIEDKVQMKEGSKGTRVGTVQAFLNLYNGTSKKVDNDYGKTTKTDVANFQRKEGLTADGEAGPATFQAMIDWLKKQG